MPRVCIAAVIAVVLATSAATAGAATCPLDELPVRVAALIGHDASDDVAGRGIRVTTEAGSDSVTGTVTIGDEHARVIEAATCGELVDALAIVVVLILRADVAPPPAPPPPAPIEPESPPVPDVSAETELAAAVSVQPRRRATPVAYAVLAGAGGSAVGARPVPELSIGIRGARGRGVVGLDLTLRAPDEVPASDAGQVTITAARASAIACYRTVVDVCAVATGGAIRGRSEGVIDARAASTPLAAGGARLAWERRIGARLSIQLHGEARAALTVSRFLVADMPVWTSPRVEATAGASLVARIP